MPRKIIQHPTSGKMYSVLHADFLATYQALGYTEVADEPDPVVYAAPATYAAVDDAGAWDATPYYYISHSDGRHFAVTFDNYVHRYQALGFTIGAGEHGETLPNLLRWSEQFDNVAWAKSSASITADAATDPLGGATADKLVEAAATAQHFLSQTAASTPGQTYTGSLYIKAAERTVARVLLLNGDTSVGVFQAIDLATGLASGGVGGTGTAQIDAIGSGWYRVSVTGVIAQSTMLLRVFPISGGTSTYPGDGSSGLYVWGAQVNAGSPAPYRMTA